MEKKIESTNKKRGRRPKDQRLDYVIKEDQTKFFVDVSKDKPASELIQNLLKQANKKEHGREIIFKDLVILALEKLSPKDIEKIQEESLSEMEKVQKALLEYNKKNNTNLNLGEFLVKKLGIN